MSSEAFFLGHTRGPQDVLASCEVDAFPEALLVGSVLVFLGRIIG